MRKPQRVRLFYIISKVQPALHDARARRRRRTQPPRDCKPVCEVGDALGRQRKLSCVDRVARARVFVVPPQFNSLWCAVGIENDIKADVDRVPLFPLEQARVAAGPHAVGCRRKHQAVAREYCPVKHFEVAERHSGLGEHEHGVVKRRLDARHRQICERARARLLRKQSLDFGEPARVRLRKQRPAFDHERVENQVVVAARHGAELAVKDAAADKARARRAHGCRIHLAGAVDHARDRALVVHVQHQYKARAVGFVCDVVLLVLYIRERAAGERHRVVERQKCCAEDIAVLKRRARRLQKVVGLVRIGHAPQRPVGHFLQQQINAPFYFQGYTSSS